MKTLKIYLKRIPAAGILAIISLMGITPSSTLAQTGPTGAINDSASYRDEIALWRQNREEGLKKEGGWPSVAGLHWLKEGDNAIGGGAGNDYVLPAGSAPDRVGVIMLLNRRAFLKVAPGVTVHVNGNPFTDSELKTDAQGKPDKVTLNDLAFTVIQRGKRTGIRLWDNNAPARKNFTGLKWYPTDKAYRITAKFVPYAPPRKMSILNILGDMEEGVSPGYVTFVLKGQEYRLETQSEGDELFINFKDETSGKETYPPGRFLYASKPVNGQVVLDFNRAYNPPCAFTEFATCPLPPSQNRLKVRIEAGEKKYHTSEDDFVPTGQTIQFADEVAAYQKADRENPPRKNQILFIGSSIVRQWTKIPERLAPLPAFNRGVGGSRTWEILHYADEIALPYEPRIIVYYCGSNDINSGEKPEAILERYRQFSDKITERLPDTTVYFLAIFRAPQKKDRWEIVDATNRLVRDYSLKTKNRAFLDANPVFFDKSGQPLHELYLADGLHFTGEAYDKLTAFIKPILQKTWEAKAPSR